MNFILILVFGILIIGVISALVSIFQTGFRMMSVITLVSSLTVLILGIFLYLDVTEFNDKFYTSPNMFMLVDNSTVLTGFYGVMESDKEKPHFFTEEMIEDMEVWYEEGDYDSMKGDNYKMFIVEIKAFEDVENITIDDTVYELEYLHSIILSDTPTEDFADGVIEREKIPDDKREAVKQDLIKQTREDIGDDSAFRGAVFASGLLGSAFEEQGAFFLLKNFQYDMVKIYKEGMLFKTMKYMPLPYLEFLMRGEGEDGNIRQDNGSQQEKGEHT